MHDVPQQHDQSGQDGSATLVGNFARKNVKEVLKEVRSCPAGLSS